MIALFSVFICKNKHFLELNYQTLSNSCINAGRLAYKVRSWAISCRPSLFRLILSSYECNGRQFGNGRDPQYLVIVLLVPEIIGKGQKQINHFPSSTSAARRASGVTWSLLSILAISPMRSSGFKTRMCDCVRSPSLSL